MWSKDKEKWQKWINFPKIAEYMTIIFLKCYQSVIPNTCHKISQYQKYLPRDISLLMEPWLLWFMQDDKILMSHSHKKDWYFRFLANDNGNAMLLTSLHMNYDKSWYIRWYQKGVFVVLLGNYWTGWLLDGNYFHPLSGFYLLLLKFFF